MSRNEEPSESMLASVPADYWLGICRGAEAAKAFIEADTPVRIGHLLATYPILGLPEFPSAMEALAELQDDPQTASACIDGAASLRDGLRSMSKGDPGPYGSLLYNCGVDLLLEAHGNRVINLIRATELFRQARVYLPRESAEFAPALLNEATARTRLSELGFESSKNLITSLQLVDEAKSLYPSESQDWARALINEAVIHTRLAQVGIEHRLNLERALQLTRTARQQFPERSSEFGYCQVNEAIILMDLSEISTDVEMSRSYIESAVSLYAAARSSFRPDSSEAASALLNEATARRGLAAYGMDRQQNLERAVQLSREAAAIFRRDSEDYAKSLMSEGLALADLAALSANRRAVLERALDLFIQARAGFVAGSYYWAGLLLNEAHLHSDLAGVAARPKSHVKAAMRLFKKAALIFMKLGFTTDAMKAFSSMGNAARQLGLWEQARRGYLQVIRGLGTIGATTYLVGHRETFVERYAHVFRDVVEVCFSLGRYEEALEHLEHGRSRWLRDWLHIVEVPLQELPPKVAKDFRRLRRRFEELEARLEAIHSLSPGIPEGLVSAIVEERSKIWQQLLPIEEQVVKKTPQWAVPKALSLEDMKALSRNVQRTLVAIFVGMEWGAAFFLTPSGLFDVVRLPEVTWATVAEWITGSTDGGSINGWIGAYLRYRSGQATTQEWMGQMDRTLSQVYEKLVAPLLQWLRSHGEKRIVLLVGGALSLLPLHAASWADDGEMRHVIDELEIVYSPSAYALTQCAQRISGQWFPVLGICNPEGPGSSALVFSEWEVTSVQAIIESMMGRGSFTILTRTAPTADRILSLLPSHPVVHFACHGMWNFERPLESKLLTAGGGQLTVGRLLGQAELLGTRLVVLSACESALGWRTESNAEEYLGLPAAFMIAGARCVVGSLWAVMDPPTAMLMVRMYQNYLGGLEVSEALRKAQQWLKALNKAEAVLETRATLRMATPALPKEVAESFESWLETLESFPFSHPYYWAAFVCFGAPDSLRVEEGAIQP